MRTKNISHACVFRWFYICTTFKYLNVVLFQRVYKYITIRAIKFLWKLGLERWVWILEFSFFIEWKKVFEINSWTGYHLMNMSNITHDFLEIAAVAVVFVYWMIFFYRKAPVRIRYLFSMFLELLTFLILVVLPLFDIYTWWVICISLPCFSWL